LVEKYANEFDLVPEDCVPYEASDGFCEDGCDVSQLSEVYRTENHRFLGGAYGKSNERVMMEEIMKNGPIVVSFEPAFDFMYYRNGVYHSVDANDWIEANEDPPEWEKVDHSVLCYGWGETENGEKYWLL
jgi:cathepsin C